MKILTLSSKAHPGVCAVFENFIGIIENSEHKFIEDITDDFKFDNYSLLILGAWIIISLKFSYWNLNFPIVILVITFTFSILYSVVVLFGFLFRSSVPGMMIAYFIFLILSPAIHFIKLQLQTLTGKEVLKSIVDGVYYFIPKTSELMGTINSNLGQGKPIGDVQPVLSSFLFLILTLFFCDYLLQKKDF